MRLRRKKLPNFSERRRNIIEDVVMLACIALLIFAIVKIRLYCLNQRGLIIEGEARERQIEESILEKAEYAVRINENETFKN